MRCEPEILLTKSRTAAVCFAFSTPAACDSSMLLGARPFGSPGGKTPSVALLNRPTVVWLSKNTSFTKCIR